MNIKIDQNGCLWIERAGKWKKMECRPAGLIQDQKVSGWCLYCSDDCPLFREPDRAEGRIQIFGITILRWRLSDDLQRLRICGGVTLVGTITDERGKE